MLAQFQSLYPTGSLVTQLLQIHEGKYLVRAKVQIDGMTRATGMAGAETIEAAEDRARERALMMLDLSSEPQVEPAPSTATPQIQASLDPSLNKSNPWSESTIAALLDPVPEAQPISSASTRPKAHKEQKPVSPPPGLDTADEEDFRSVGSTTSPNNVAQFVKRSPTPKENPSVETTTNINEPEDMSDDIAKINVLMTQINWTKDQKQKYLQLTYRKMNESLLTDAEVREFRRYLEHYAQSDAELKRLGWTQKQGQDYLIQKFGKDKRALLNVEQLQEFVTDIKSQFQPTPIDPEAGF